MSLAHNPSIVTSNLLLNLDFKNPKKFSTNLGSGNLVQNSNYNASTWSNLFPANTTITTGIDAPDGTYTAVRLSCATTGSSLLRVSFNSFTPNGTSSYAVSFFVRKISGTTSTSNQLYCDLHDGTPSGDYVSQLVTNEWVRVVFTGVPTATAKTFFDLLSDNTNNYVLDFWGVKIESYDTNSEVPVKDTIGGYTFNLYRPYYYTFDSSFIEFTRTASAPKHGSLGYSTLSGDLAVTNFLYNNHTWEVWFKINDITPGGYSDATEGASNLIAYRGYHAGFQYTGSNLQYYIWNGVSTIPTCASWTLGTSGAQVNQGSWYQAVVTRSGNVFTPYLNGVQLGTGSTTVTSVAGVGTSNDLHIGGMANASAGTSSYVYYPKNSLANVKMYNRALTLSEINKNFNALRGRFGL